MLNIRSGRFVPPELVLLHLAIVVIVNLLGFIISIYRRKKKERSTTWTCVCSRVHLGNRYVCPCGRTKFSVLTEETVQSPVKPTDFKGWVCTCGRENASYQSSCVCGISKREIKIASTDQKTTSGSQQ